ncbi:MAG: PilW family protein [Acidiferrobacter sp.]
MSLRRLSITSRHHCGFTLVELMVALVVSAIAALAIFGAFSGLSSAMTQTKAQDNTWQQARTAMTMLTQAIESAGYGLPMNECGGGIYTNVPLTSTSQQFTTSTSSPSGGMFLTAVADQVQTTGTPFDYDPTTTNTYALTTVTGGNVFGSAAAATITGTHGKSVTSANFFVNNSTLLSANDIFLVALPNSSCLLGQITNIGGANNIVGNSGKSTYNAPGAFSATDPGITASQLLNAGLIDLGNSGFSVKNFFIQDDNGAGVPSLYMQTYPYNVGTGPAPNPMLVARGIVDMQFAFGYGTNGVVSAYVGPLATPPAGMTPGDLLTVEVALLVRSTRYTPGQYAGTGGAPPAITIMNSADNPAIPTVTYTIPTNLPAGQTMECVQGNCNQYLYRVFQTVIPVRNDIWGQ